MSAAHVAPRNSVEPSPPGVVGQALAVLGKDLQSELRNRAALNAIFLFALTALVVIAFAVGKGSLDAQVQAALLWVLLFFAAFAGLSHVFLHEEEASTATALRLSAAPGAIYAGKLLFNLLLLAIMAVLLVPLYMLLLNVNPARPAEFALVVFTGAVGLGSAATIVAAIIAKARGKGALYGALGFPILLPLLFMTVDATRAAIQPSAPESLVVRDIIGLVSFGVMVITASALLFPYVWED